MKAHLRSKLQESGWFDDVNELALGKRAHNSRCDLPLLTTIDKLSVEESPKFDTVAKSLESQALSKYLP